MTSTNQRPETAAHMPQPSSGTPHTAPASSPSKVHPAPGCLSERASRCCRREDNRAHTAGRSCVGAAGPVGLGRMHQTVGEPVAARGRRGHGQLAQGRAGDRGVLVGAEQVLPCLQAALQTPRRAPDDRHRRLGGVAAGVWPPYGPHAAPRPARVPRAPHRR